jgi:hypothetical protein
VGDELGCWACGGPVEGPLWAPGGALSVHEWGMAPPGKKCVLRDTIMCDASMCGDGEGCHDDSPTLLYTGVCSVGSVVSSFFFVKPPLLGPGSLGGSVCARARWIWSSRSSVKCKYGKWR